MSPTYGWGISVVESAAVTPGEMLSLPGSGQLGPGLTTEPLLVAGVGRLTDTEWCRREARRIVRLGLADVLAWLGDTSRTRTDPVPVMYETGWWRKEPGLVSAPDMRRYLRS